MHVWAPIVTLTMCEDSGQKDGDMLDNRGPQHSVFRRGNRRSKQALQVKCVMP